jgi:hypothetical protein
MKNDDLLDSDDPPTVAAAKLHMDGNQTNPIARTNSAKNFKQESTNRSTKTRREQPRNLIPHDTRIQPNDTDHREDPLGVLPDLSQRVNQVTILPTTR